MSAAEAAVAPVIRARNADRLESEIRTLLKRLSEIRKAEDLHECDAIFIDGTLAFEGVYGWRGLSLAQVGRAISIVAHFTQTGRAPA